MESQVTSSDMSMSMNMIMIQLMFIFMFMKFPDSWLVMSTTPWNIHSLACPRNYQFDSFAVNLIVLDQNGAIKLTINLIANDQFDSLDQNAFW